MISRVHFLLALVMCASIAVNDCFRIFAGPRRSVKALLKAPRRSGSVLFAKEKEVIPENETAEEQRERLRKKARKSMFNENGVAYAPWMARQIDEEAMIDLLIRKEAGETGPVKTTATTILDRGEIETADGMKWRMSGNQVDLAWVTGGETNNVGYVVEKRPSYGGDFQEVASFREVSNLASKGPRGGRYRYTDPSTAAGSWVYRVKDCDGAGQESVLCQCFVEVQTEAESKGQVLVAAGFVAVLAALAVAGFALDPPR